LTRKRRRLWIILSCGLGLGSAAALSLAAFRQDMVFFLAPSDVAQAQLAPGRSFRLGGLVEAGSVRKTVVDGHPAASFRVTDGHAAVPVTFVGILPDLFREGQGIVALGTLSADGDFRASDVLAKHDETYMPKDVADALKRTGRWNPTNGPPPPASTWNTLVPKAPDQTAQGKPEAGG
jgi:cytochrome c-type biogenesis protein CcmE